jgi:hypothetical protein
VRDRCVAQREVELSQSLTKPHEGGVILPSPLEGEGLGVRGSAFPGLLFLVIHSFARVALPRGGEKSAENFDATCQNRKTHPRNGSVARIWWPVAITSENCRC